METLFFVQPYRLKHHRLVAGGALAFDDQDEAISAGRRTARFRPGVVVLSQEIDTRSGHKGKPNVIAIHGRVPDPWRALAPGREAA